MTAQDVKALRTSLGLTQDEFAEILQVSRMTVIRAEAGKPSRALVNYIENALGRGLLRLTSQKLNLPPRRRKKPKK
jgi:transcriptional regulator with XRE-family HTH domain